MSDSQRPGLKATLAADVAAVRAPRDAAEKLDLFELANDAKMPMDEASGADSTARAGRPKGAQNVRTRVVADYYLRRYGDPLEALLRMGMRPVGQFVADLRRIAAESGVPLLGKNQSLVNLVGLQTQALDAALPYLRQKMPLAIDAQVTTRDVLILGAISAQQRDQAAALGIDLDGARAPAKSLELQANDADADDAAPQEAAPHGG